MKKLVTIITISLLCILAGCGKKTTKEKAFSSFKDAVTEAKSYKLDGQMNVLRSGGEVSFDIEVSYQAPSYYKVLYENKENNSRQVLLKNTDGVYVLTPELNKEFKFDSTWPANSSHIYILDRILADLDSDTEKKVSENDDYYILTSKIAHKVKKDLVEQSVYLSKNDYSLKKVTYNTLQGPVMTFTVSKLVYGVTFGKSEFDVDAIMNSETSLMGEGSKVEVNKILFSDVIEEVSLKSSTVNNDTTVLTYEGAKNYFIIYGDAYESEVSTIERVYSDFVLLYHGIGFVSSNCLTFYKNNKEFKIISNVLTLEEMVEVANSLQMA